MRGTMMERFMANVNVNPYGCWLWTGALTSAGRGHFTPGKRPDGKADQWLAYRFLYVVSRGGIPDGLELDHLCRNPRCVNPWHLEPVTHAVNIARIPRGPNCVNGHARDGNTVTRSGQRVCLICYQEHHRQYKARIRDSQAGMREARKAARRAACAEAAAIRAAIRNAKPRRENITETNARKTHCPQGHPYSGNNLHVTPTRRRVCRACSREASRLKRARQQQAVAQAA